MRSAHSDEQSAEQLQEVNHPEAKIAYRGIGASPDAIFGSHSQIFGGLLVLRLTVRNENGSRANAKYSIGL